MPENLHRVQESCVVKLICEKCQKVVLFEKIITPKGKVYHVSCWERDDE